MLADCSVPVLPECTCSALELRRWDGRIRLTVVVPSYVSFNTFPHALLVGANPLEID